MKLAAVHPCTAASASAAQKVKNSKHWPAFTGGEARDGEWECEAAFRILWIQTLSTNDSNSKMLSRLDSPRSKGDSEPMSALGEKVRHFLCIR
mmetsp:Transcript_7543/g.14820  ORF Transcript_7543/g.14820 Transcript_7543/m.14820 type:complete len:93 (-) Transcript_7543:92-370(-)